MFTVTEVYNNIASDSSLVSDFGFSCFIKEAGLLFDTGAKKDVLLNNLSSLGIKKSDIKAVFLSHDHWDHKGGISIIEEINPKVKTFALSSFSDETLLYLSRNSDLHIVQEQEEIMPGIFSTGALGDEICEQAVAIKTEKGFFVISGCSHPHIENVLSSVRQKGRVFGLIGGLHDVTDSDIRSLAGIDYLAPSHCTKRLFDIKSTYPGSFIETGAGFIHRIL